MGEGGPPPVDFALLGALEVRRGGRPEPIVPGRERALLLLLLLHAPRPLSTDRLIDELWGDRPPDTVATMLQVYVSRLRKALESGRGAREVLVTERGGYRLAIAPEQVDAHRFERLLTAARERRAAGDPVQALALADEALTLWRGPPLADVALEGWAAPEIARLDALHADVLEERIEAGLQLGEHVSLLPQIERLVTDHPLREGPYRQQMLALYRAGRQAEALEAYQRARRVLDERLGVAPGPSLRRLERAILDQDPSLDAPPIPERHRSAAVAPRRVRRLAPIAVVAIALLALGMAALVSSIDRRAPTRVRGTVAVLLGSRSQPVLGQVPIGSGPRFAAAGPLAGRPEVWVANVVDRSLTAIDARTRQPIPPLVALGAPPAGIAVGAGAVWASEATRAEIVRIDPRYHGLRRIRLPGGPGATAGPIAVGDGSVWVGVDPDQLLRLDPRTGRVLARIRVAVPASIAYGDGALWLGGWDGSIVRVDTSADATVRTVAHLPAAVGGITVGGGSVWASVGLDGSLWQIREDGVTQRSFAVGRAPGGVAYAAGKVYVGSGEGPTSVLDVASSALSTLPLGEPAAAVVAVRVGRASEVWAAAAPASSSTAPGGVRGLARFVQHGYQGIDPAMLYDPRSWQLEYATCAKLFNVADRPGPATLVPELAAGWPRVTDGGRTYTFHIRHGYRFSPPSNQPVTAAALQHTIARALSPQLGAGAPGMLFVGDIVGAAAFHDGRTSRLSGIEAHGDTLVIRLARPAGDLPARLSTPIFCAVPLDTPALPGGVTTPVPSAGPYYVASVDPPNQMVLLRNPNYGGTRPSRLRGVVWSTGVLWEQSGAKVVSSGQDDYIAGLDARPPFQPGGPVDRVFGHRASRRPRLYFSALLGIEYLDLDARSGPLRDVRLRRAVDLALDRPAIAAALGLRPADALLPPGMPGYRDPRPALLAGPQIADARALTAGRHPRLTLAVRDRPDEVAAGQIVVRDLGRAGLRVRLERVPDTYRAHADLLLTNWRADYPDPADFLNTLLDPREVTASGGVPRFAGAAWIARLRRASALQGAARRTAYAALATALSRNAAPWAVIGAYQQPELLSGRLGCRVYQPAYGSLSIGQLCLDR